MIYDNINKSSGTASANALKKNLQHAITGREAESVIITAQLSKAGKNACSVLVIGGDPGVGKTALVKSALSEMQENDLICSYGKFEQYKDEEPYVAIIQIINDITDHLLTLSEGRLKHIQQKLLRRLGKNAALITKAVPRAQCILKIDKSVTKNYYQRVKLQWEIAFNTFIETVAEELQPFVIFIDDIQWADRPSVEMIKSVTACLNKTNLHIILAHRTDRGISNDNVKEIKENLPRELVTEINLDNLLPEDINNLIISAFKNKLERPSELVNLLYGKTMGNPLNVKQTLIHLLDSGNIYFDEYQDQWIWRLPDGSFALSGEIEDFIDSKIAVLGEAEKEVLETAACMGTCFQLDLLASATEYAPASLETALKKLIKTGLIIDKGHLSRSKKHNEYAFLHDKISQIVYQRIYPAKREQIHFKIAMRQFDSPDKSILNEHLLSVMAHFLKCKKIVRENVNASLIEPLYRAGLQAKQTAAAEHALGLFVFCEELLGPACWEKDYTRALKVKLEIAQCEFICGFLDDSEKHFGELLSQAKRQTDLAEIKKQYMVLNYYVGKYETVIVTGFEALYHLGFDIDNKSLKGQIARELLHSKVLFRGKRLKQIKNASHVKDQKIIELLEILNIMAGSANLINSDLFLYIVLKTSNLSAKYGNSPYAPVGYAAYSLILGSLLDKYSQAEIVEEIAIDLLEQCEDEGLKCQTAFILGAFVHHWNHPSQQSLDLLRNCFDYGINAGEYLYSGFAVTAMLEIIYFSGKPLHMLSSALTLYEQYGNKTNHDIVLRLIRFFKTQLQYLTDPGTDAAKHDTNTGRTYDLLKIQRLYLEEKKDSAYALCSQAIAELDLIAGYYLQVDYVFYYLLLSSLISEKPKKLSNNGMYKKYKKRLRAWAENNPREHMARYLLVEALYLSSLGKRHDAAEAFDKAIDSAGQSQNIFLEALGNSLAADFYSTKRKISTYYAAEACRLFIQWGCKNMALRIAERFNIMPAGKQADEKYIKQTEADNIIYDHQPEISLMINLREIQKKLETLDLKAAYQYFLKMVCTHFSADRGAIFLENDDKLLLKHLWTKQNGIEDYEEGLDAERIQDIPRSVIRYAGRTYEEVALAEKPMEGHFSRDRYLKKRTEISLLCLPIKYKGIFAGLIYLERRSQNGFHDLEPDSIQSLTFYLVAKEALERENGLQNNAAALPAGDQLTSRETEVLKCMATGMTNKVIAEKLGIYSSTVKTHTLRLYKKLGVNSRVQAVTKAKNLLIIT